VKWVTQNDVLKIQFSHIYRFTKSQQVKIISDNPIKTLQVETGDANKTTDSIITVNIQIVIINFGIKNHFWEQ